MIPAIPFGCFLVNKCEPYRSARVRYTGFSNVSIYSVSRYANKITILSGLYVVGWLSRVYFACVAGHANSLTYQQSATNVPVRIHRDAEYRQSPRVSNCVTT